MAFAAGEAADSELSYDPNRELLGSKESCQGLAFGVSMRQGSRPYMEDVTVAQPVPQHANFMIFAVFDGHGGKKAADYAKEHLPQVLSEELTADGSDPGQCLLRAFEKTDEKFISGSEGAQDGCTATACLIRNGEEIWVANAGDSRTILVKTESVIQVTTDHKPNEPTEKARILAAGGSIIFYGVWRVNGMLATSRGFGDASLKPIVIATPEIFPRRKEADDMAIILCSDGVFDTVENDQIGTVVRAKREAGGALDDVSLAIASELTSSAIAEGSYDNVAAVVVRAIPASHFNATLSCRFVTLASLLLLIALCCVSVLSAHI